jgi:methylphosphotriester-DNA--protein-cysteine methyltransferase
VRFAETTPPGALAPWVACFWSITAADAPAFTDRILPDGCADVIIDLARAPYAFVVGAMSTALRTPVAGRVDLFGIRFRPGSALPFLGVPLREVTDQRVALDALWGSRGAALLDVLANVAPHDRVRHAERLLTARDIRTRREDDIVPQAVSLFRRARGGAAVRHVAAALGVGERRLVRAFDRCVGLSPKGFARVMRFREVYRQIQRGDVLRWTQMAGDAGYADQPHLIREFQSLAGLTPAQYVAERQGVRFVQYQNGGAL